MFHWNVFFYLVEIKTFKLTARAPLKINVPVVLLELLRKHKSKKHHVATHNVCNPWILQVCMVI